MWWTTQCTKMVAEYGINVGSISTINYSNVFFEEIEAGSNQKCKWER